MTESLYSRGELVKAGYLVKSPPLSRALVSQWHRRWFLLMDSRLVYPLAERYVRLVYYQSEADAKRLADPKGSINLNSCLSVVSLNECIRNYKFVFDVCTNDRVYHLAADTEEERMDWVSTLKHLLFSPQQTNGESSNLQQSYQHRSPEVQKRVRDDPKVKRPVSFTGGLHSESKPRGSTSVQSRPLPPVPASVESNASSSPVERRNRPLPATPDLSQSIHIHPIGPQSSPVPVKRKIPPPIKPTPYRKNKSEPSPPPTNDIGQPSQSHNTRAVSLSPPPCQVLAEDYQEFVFQPGSSIDNDPDIGNEDNYSLATSVPRQSPQALMRRPSPNTLPVKISSVNEDYSVLNSTAIQGYDPKDETYSHLKPTVVTDSPPPPIRGSSLALHPATAEISHKPKPQPKARTKSPNQRPRSAIPDYVNCPSPPNPTNDDYSRLHH